MLFRQRFAVLALLAFAIILHAEPAPDFWPGRMLVQFSGSPEQWTELSKLTSSDPQVQELFRTWKVSAAKQKYPLALPPEVVGGIELRTWWNIEVPTTTDIQAVIRDFESRASVLHAQPDFVYTIDLQYNDPQFNQQWGMTRVHSNEAHDFSTGDPAVIVAIVDTGVQYTHPDLSPNMWVNPGEDLNHNGIVDASDVDGLDNDSDGFRDNFYGADAVSDDGDPFPSAAGTHGTHCAGIASAKTNNNVGVASLGFSCSIMAIRSGDAQYVTQGYEGIEWAARKGAHIISLSWGGNSSSAHEQAVVDYAWNRNCVVLAAAGNSGVNTLHYPSALNHVVAVASTQSQDRKSGFSNYGTWVDVCAPGSQIRSTVPTNSYATWDGTSMACPFAAGLAALIKSRLLLGSNADVINILESSCDNIDGLNASYAGQLGHGRINALTAMEMLNEPMIRMESGVISERQGDFDGRVEPGESGNLTLFLHAVSGYANVDTAWAVITNSDPTVQIAQSVFPIGRVNAGTNWSNEFSPAQFTVSGTATLHMSHFNVRVFAEPNGQVFDFPIDYFIGWPELLIIDDDEGGRFESVYTSKIDSLGLTYSLYDMTMNGTLPDGYMDHFQWVIWETGNSTGTLDNFDQAQVGGYLQGGGKLLLSSQQLPEDPNTIPFMTTVLGVSPLGNGLLIDTMYAVTGSPIGSGTGSLFIGNRTLNGTFSQSTVTPLTGTEVDYTINNQACVVHRSIGTSGKLVFASVALEGVSPTTETTDLLTLLTSVREWFNVTAVEETTPASALPTRFEVSEVYPNPFNSTASVRISLPQAGNFTVTVFDRTGRVVYSGNQTSVSAGIHTVKMNMEHLSSGIYFVHVATTTGTTTRKAVYLR